MIRKEEIKQEAEFMLMHGEVKEIKDFIKGAEWAVRTFEENRLAACDRQTEEEGEREMQFVADFLSENSRMPTFSDCIEITRKDIIDKACQWLKAQRIKTFFLIYFRVCDNELIERFRKAMED